MNKDAGDMYICILNMVRKIKQLAALMPALGTPGDKERMMFCFFYNSKSFSKWLSLITYSF